MAKAPEPNTYSDEEAEARMQAALRGARAAGHKTLQDVSPKRESKLARKPKAAKASK